MNAHALRIVFVAALGSLVAGAHAAAQTNPAPRSIDERIDALEKELNDLKQQREADREAATARAKAVPLVTAGKEGFRMQSADGSFILKMRGYVQADGRFYLDDKARTATDTFLMRRVRPIFEGTVYRDLSFKIMPDFGGGTTVLYDAYIDWRHWDGFGIRAGKFKPPIGLERLQSATDIEFVERALPTDLVPNRDVGVQVFGDLWGGVIGYAGGLFNGVMDGALGDLDSNDGKDLAGRIFAQPFKKTEIAPLEGLGFGIAGSWGRQSGNTNSLNLPSYKSVGQQTFFSYVTKTNAPGPVFAHGERTRWTPQGYYYWGPIGVLGEYVVSDQQVQHGIGGNHTRLSNSAWQAAGYWVITGEKASYRGVTPRRPFDLRGGFGAVELAGRYSELHIDGDAFPAFADITRSARDVREWAVGINWYLDSNVKLMMDYDRSDFLGGGARPDEQVLFARLQLSF